MEITTRHFEPYCSPYDQATREAKNLAAVKEIMLLMDERNSFGIISPFSPFVTDLENWRRQARLKKDMKAIKHEYVEFISGYDYPENEKVTKIRQWYLFVPEITLNTLLLYGLKYNQENVIHGDRVGATADRKS